MKILKDGSMAFYASKWHYLAFILIACYFIILFITTNNDARPEVGYVLAIISGLLLLFIIYKFFIDMTVPYIKLTQNTVEIQGVAPLLWEDIYTMHIETRRVGKRNKRRDYMCFEVRDLSFYKLTLGQKWRRTCGGTPFELDLHGMSKKDRELFEREIRARLRKDIDRLLEK